MAQSAYLYFVEGSEVASMTLDELKARLNRYVEQTSITGKQLGWDYADAAFPYTIETKPEAGDQWFYLKGKTPLYHHIIFGIGSKQKDGAADAATDGEGEEAGAASEVHYIQIVLPDGSTHGDKAKANELVKYLGKHLKAETHLFNGRIMYFNPRK
ncbi:DUF1885 family protein [Xylanibacillus composti]|uniref:DUF1885 family protein n=1 Tax=Xylanibacillus composti TaxID=1572762 RepID=A0A8J4H3L0_9BACL|nr:DUF1885 family protein [Xylanibacillus composti]MDT9724196.1 DUF1885 family protein [Xylanibacillus composti]GIQ68289.1 hypothetical protein XYCOK13_11130 [Xylanibacillus composti]